MRSDAELRHAAGDVQVTPSERIGGVCLAIVLGIAGAALLLHWALSSNVVS